MNHFSISQKSLIIISSITAALLTLALIATNVSSEFNWQIGDFIAAAVIIGGAGYLSALSMKLFQSPTQKKLGVSVVILGAMVVWAALASDIEAKEHEAKKYEHKMHQSSMNHERSEGLKMGKGMGYAKVAETNGYPGPKHVLELSKELELTDEQKQKTQAIFESVQKDAKALGAELVAAEEALEAMFKAGEVTAEKAQKQLAMIAELEGKVRAVHVLAHVKQQGLMTQHQIHLYSKLRGHSKDGHTKEDHKHHH